MDNTKLWLMILAFNVFWVVFFYALIGFGIWTVFNLAGALFSIIAIALEKAKP